MCSVVPAARECQRRISKELELQLQRELEAHVEEQKRIEQDCSHEPSRLDLAKHCQASPHHEWSRTD